MTTEKLQTTNSAIEQNLPRRVVRFVKDGRLLTRQLNSKQEKQRLFMVSLDVGY
jgi:hypothetical protein